MGQIIEASFDQIVPSENGLFASTLWDVIKFSESGRKMAPVPVREKNGKFMQLDGRHRLIYYYLIGIMPDIYLAEHDRDYMLKSDFPYIDNQKLDNTNNLINSSWYCSRLNVKDYHEHFRNLRNFCEFLTDYPTCREYLSRTFEK